MPELARHEVGVFGHRAKRVRRCQCPMMNDANDLRWMLSMMDWSTINNWAARTDPHLPLRMPRTTFSASNFELEIWLLSEPSKSTKSGPKSLQNPPPDPSKTGPKRHLILQTPKIKNNATLPRFCSFLTFPDSRKSSQNRCKNAFKISFMLHTLLEPWKIRFWMLKHRQDGRPKFPVFFVFKNRTKF